MRGSMDRPPIGQFNAKKAKSKAQIKIQNQQVIEKLQIEAQKYKNIEQRRSTYGNGTKAPLSTFAQSNLTSLNSDQNPSQQKTLAIQKQISQN